MARKWITGIDIGHHSTKAVVLAYEGSDIKIVNQLELNGCAAIFADPYTLKHQETVKKLKILRKIVPIFRKQAAIAIPESTVVSKVINLDARLVNDELEYAVHQAMSYQTPYDSEALAIDYVAVPPQNEPNPNQETAAYQVHVARHNIIDNRIQVVKALGFKPQLISTNIHALRSVQKLVLTTYPQFSNWVLLDVGQKNVSLLPPLQLPLELHKAWSIACDQDAHLAIQAPYNSAISTQFGTVLHKVSAQLQLFRSMLEGHQVGGLFLTGGHVQDSDVVDLITTRTNMSVECISDYLTSLSDNQYKLGSTYATALGIALNAIHWTQEH
ncbi:pilus assembly protein PilM [Vibrio sp. McD22-P3]|uniref:pilus assembly protein PilM n=1 Tax=Vibrio sp. McD22-P3 TaxID=2724880 RepID=UPI001F3E6869|nr:pilus assembly protein PilM [Vibrio sp. McD22-P3]MCF4175234.1 pilus assembly protein PilM [Vibrio sp. McD22-P3]